MDHEYWMKMAYREAERAYEQNEIPVGAIVVFENRIIGRGYNQVEMLTDPTAHAEMIAITAAVSTLGSKWLNGATLYVTLEPCSMCAGAMVLARFDALVFGAPDPKTGACGSIANIVQNDRLNHRLEVVGGVYQDYCSAILRDFFLKLRKSPRSEV
ncbi:MAG: tRNA adenosine(34) deaminase TadA [Bacteroidetes bacterium]|nr:tRNA adenosine(34) deaminase TadA [Bacteroidota bacterium]